MKYRVKFWCYWYNTGRGDNHSGWNYEDFDTLEEAEAFKAKLIVQYEMWEKYDKRQIGFNTYSDFRESEEFYEVEGGHIDNYNTIHIVKYIPEQEIPL